nr:alpha/beta fold hydrolase [Acidimicrobiia bacterium]
MPDVIVPAPIDVPEAQLDDLRTRLARTRWPERETVEDWSQGVPLAYLQEVCSTWRDEYDWRCCERELNRYGQLRFVDVGPDGAPLGIQVLHAPSPHADALPLVLTHGWPGSTVEFLDVVEALRDPAANGRDAADAFHVVCPSLPGYGFSDRPASTGWNVEAIADSWARLMSALGYERFGAQGGDWGAMITSALGTGMPDNVAGIHVTMPLAQRPPEGEVPPLTKAEQAALNDRRLFQARGTGYSAEQSTRPQTIGYGLLDSPAAQC